MCHDELDGGKLHGNISRNGYGNAIIGRYGGGFKEGIWWVRESWIRGSPDSRTISIGRTVRL